GGRGPGARADGRDVEHLERPRDDRGGARAGAAPPRGGPAPRGAVVVAVLVPRQLGRAGVVAPARPPGRPRSPAARRRRRRRRRGRVPGAARRVARGRPVTDVGGLADLAGTTVALLVLTAFAAGWVDAVVGGGGLLQLPALLLVPGMAPVQALATNKLASVMGTSVSAATYYRRVRPDLRTALPTAVAALAGSAG